MDTKVAKAQMKTAQIQANEGLRAVDHAVDAALQDNFGDARLDIMEAGRKFQQVLMCIEQSINAIRS